MILTRAIKGCVQTLGRLVQRFRGDSKANIAIIFAFASTVLVVGVGSGIDLSRAYQGRQKLSEVATLTCQYSTRPSVVSQANSTAGSAGGFANYLTLVNSYASSALTSQLWNLGTPMGGPSLTPNGNFFTATAPTGIGSNTTPANPTAELTANVPTLFLSIVGITQISVHAKVGCAGALQSDPNLISEGFETPCASYCFTLPSGAPGTTTSAQNTFSPSTGYTGSGGALWNIMGYCLETDVTGQINSTSPEGSHTAELDCDNGSGSAGNSSISTKVYMQSGYYELRYFFRSRIPYVNYDPVYICGTTAADLSWANDTGWGWYGSRTNQINVYLDQNVYGSAPTHRTIDGSQQLAGSNLIDMCVQSTNWVERSIKIKVTTPAYYWVSFAADGNNDSYGGQIDNIRLCPEKCAGTPQDNFPSLWLSANNGGVNKVLFEENFESPVYHQDPYVSSAHAKGGNLAQSTGVTVTSSGCFAAPFTYPSPPGWPCQVSTGWAVAPYNEVVYWMQNTYMTGISPGGQYISLQGWNGFSNSSDPLNRSINRKFLLDPGYYSVSYNYTSLTDFSYSSVYTNAGNPNCATAPTVANNYSLNGIQRGYDYANTSTLYSQYESTNIVDVFMSSTQLVSTPNVNPTLGAAPTYTNPDGTTTSSPTAVTPDNGTNFAAYSSTAPNPVINSCTYSSGFNWVQQSVNVKILKPGYYTLTFSALGDPLTALGAGPGIDDVKLTALGSLQNPPTGTVVAIPVPDPQPDTNYYGPSSNPFTGFYIVADPLAPPAADQ